jgi:hypothetical protein
MAYQPFPFCSLLFGDAKGFCSLYASFWVAEFLLMIFCMSEKWRNLL